MLVLDYTFPYYVGAAVVLLVLVLLETGYLVAARGIIPSTRTTVVNASIFAVDLILRGLGLAVRLAAFVWLGSLVPWSLEPTVLSLVATYVAVDFIYYWKHRLFHATRLGWALHSTHHSSTELNFLATFRLNWIEAMLSYFFFAPLALVGLPPVVLLLLIELNDGWQFVCHTQLVNRFKWLDRFVNTPNIHRVHHARQRELYDRNFGSTLMLWDRLFGTYHPGLEHSESGIEGDERPDRIMVIEFGGLARLVREWRRESQLRRSGSRPEPS